MNRHTKWEFTKKKKKEKNKNGLSYKYKLKLVPRNKEPQKRLNPPNYK